MRPQIEIFRRIQIEIWQNDNIFCKTFTKEHYAKREIIDFDRKISRLQYNQNLLFNFQDDTLKSLRIGNKVEKHYLVKVDSSYHDELNQCILSIPDDEIFKFDKLFI